MSALKTTASVFQGAPLLTQTLDDPRTPRRANGPIEPPLPDSPTEARYPSQPTTGPRESPSLKPLALAALIVAVVTLALIAWDPLEFRPASSWRAKKATAAAPTRLDPEGPLNPTGASATTVGETTNVTSPSPSPATPSSPIAASTPAVPVESVRDPLVEERFLIHYDRGGEAFAKGDYDLAVAEYDQAHKLIPRDAAAIHNRGSAHHKAGRIDRALEDYDRAIALDSKDPTFFFNRGNLKNFDQQRYAEAINDYNRVLALDPANTTVLIRRSKLHEKLGQTEQARADLARVRDLDNQAGKQGATAP